MGSVIKWNTGEPEENGSYLVTFKYCYFNDLNTLEKLYETAIGQTYWEGFWHNYDDRRHDCRIIAWCKMSDIEPYKE